MIHYIHRPAPPGGERDPRFREVTDEIQAEGFDLWDETHKRWRLGVPGLQVFGLDGSIWRLAESDWPSDETLKLAENHDH